MTALPVQDDQTIDPLTGVLQSASEAVQESANEGAPSFEQQLLLLKMDNVGDGGGGEEPR